MSAGSPLRVAVLGAGGIIARAIVRDLAESPEVAGLTLLDLDGERAAAVAREQGGGRAVGATVDGRVPGALAAVLADCDVLVNSASYRINLDAMAAALAAGCHYLDLGGLYWMTARQLELHERFEQAGLLAVLGIGSSPGKTNVMAVRAVRELDGDAVERIDVCAASRDPGAGDDGALHVPYALVTLLDEITLAPVVLRDGAPVEIEPLHDGGQVEFPQPVGRVSTIHTLHSELLTFGTSFHCEQASFRLSLSDALLSRLRGLVGASPERVAQAAATALPQSSRTVSAHVVTASTESRSVRVSALTVPHLGWGLGGGIVSTATPAAAAVRLLARGEIDARGVHPPEACIDPDNLFAELAPRGCTFAVLSSTR